jgi:hypothetical protein
MLFLAPRARLASCAERVAALPGTACGGRRSEWGRNLLIARLAQQDPEQRLERVPLCGETLADDDLSPVGHTPDENARRIAVEGNHREFCLAAARHRRLVESKIYLLWVDELLTGRPKCKVEHASSVTHRALNAPRRRSWRRQQNWQRLLGAAGEVPINLIQQHAVECDVNRRPQHGQDASNDKHRPGDQSPSNGRKEPAQVFMV